MIEGKIKRAERANRRKAILLTILFHIVLIGGFVLSEDGGLERWMPDFVKELFVEPGQAASDTKPAA